MSRLYQSINQKPKRHRWWLCGRKRGYPTATRAAHDLERLEERTGDRRLLERYHCGKCKGFHVGHAEQERQ